MAVWWTSEDELAQLTLDLIDLPSVSGNESGVEELIRRTMPPSHHLLIDHDSVLFFMSARNPRQPLVVLAGHTDTVPIDNNVPGRREAGTLYGRGASDMKGGLAVMLTVALEAAKCSKADVDVAFLFFGREELPASENPLPSALAASDLIRSADLAVLMEPTSNAVEAGCQGNLNLELTFRGEAAHSARPWLGDNAAHRAFAALAPIAEAEPVDVVIGGLVFREVATITGVRSGIARNVVPPIATVDLNIRYCPCRTATEVEALWVNRCMTLGAEVTVISNALPAPVMIDHPLTERLLDCGAGAPQPKQAWTNAADFAAHGVPAINFGPGDPAFAHTADERISVDALVESLAVLRRFLGLK